MTSSEADENNNNTDIIKNKLTNLLNEVVKPLTIHIAVLINNYTELRGNFIKQTQQINEIKNTNDKNIEDLMKTIRDNNSTLNKNN